MDRREQMIAERNATEARLRREMDEALTRCRDDWAADQCRKAYSEMIYAEGDAIEQRYMGPPGRLYRAKPTE